MISHFILDRNKAMVASILCRPITFTTPLFHTSSRIFCHVITHGYASYCHFARKPLVTPLLSIFFDVIPHQWILRHALSLVTIFSCRYYWQGVDGITWCKGDALQRYWLMTIRHSRAIFQCYRDAHFTPWLYGPSPPPHARHNARLRFRNAIPKYKYTY